MLRWTAWSTRYYVCISCFGVMFFADPVAAFTNIGRALRPGARMALLAWDAQAQRVVQRDRPGHRRALLPRCPDVLTRRPAHDGRQTGPAAGFTDVTFTDVREPVYYGADSGQAYDFVTGLEHVNMLASLDPAAAEDALRGLRVTLAGHTTRDGVLFGARTWIITARTPRQQRGSAPDIEDLGRIGQERQPWTPAGRRVTPARSPPAPPL